MTDLERRFAQVHSDIEHEKSFKSNFELQQEKDRKKLERRRKLEEEGKSLSELSDEMGITTDQLEDDWDRRWEATRAKYKFDQIPDVSDERALHRKLDRKLALIVRQNFPSTGKDYASPWILPELKNDGEPLRQTAERCLGNLFDDSVRVTVFGNAPLSCYPYTYPKALAERLDAYGKMIFVYQAQLHELYKSIKFNSGTVSDYRCRQGKLRLQKWYFAYPDKTKKKITRELVTTILSRKPKMCAFLEYKDMKVVYKRYASLYFCCAVEEGDNELACLEVIHRYVELLDRYFGSVCELDIIFNFEKAYFILDEFLIAGEVQETSKKQVLKAISAQDALQDEEITQGFFEDNGLG
ncbi:adapter-related protein complex 1 sigma 1B subunit [Aphelenchoides avenae]|nr:adapter-related protein complex 1 sigma 1B subunit [Aphelenchus avenae]